MASCRVGLSVTLKVAFAHLPSSRYGFHPFCLLNHYYASSEVRTSEEKISQGLAKTEFEKKKKKERKALYDPILAHRQYQHVSTQH